MSHEPASQTPPFSVAIIGAGAVGTSLGRRLVERGVPVSCIISRRLDAARRLADEVMAARVAVHLDALPDEVNLTFICVTDDAVREIVTALGQLPRSWSGHTVAHTSGAITAHALHPLKRRGATTLSFHPLQSFHVDSPPSSFDGIFAAIESDAAGVAAGQRLASLLGIRPFVIPAGGKVRYHLAASIASNFVVTLLGVVADVLATLDVDRTTAMALVRPLLDGTLANVDRLGPEQALTGPIARGDAQTVAAHLSELDTHLPGITPLYVSLAVITLQAALRSGKIDVESAQEVFEALKMVD